jgi:hypothetical protein
MKKSFLLIAMLLLFGGSMFAQDFDLGVKFGYQTSHLSYKKADIKSDFLNHMTFGLFGRIEIGSFYIEPEVLYYKTGDIFELTAENISEGWTLPEEKVTFTLNESNLQVPILFGWKALDLGVVALRLQAGPTASFTLASKTLFDETFKLTNTSGGSDETINEGTNLGLDTKSIAWGLQAGIGADILGKVTVDINYNFGLSSVFGNLNNTSLGKYFNFNNIDQTKKNTFLVTVGYKFL